MPHVVVAINKMDLVDHSEERFDEIVAEFAALAGRLDLDLDQLTFMPISALAGDNVVERSDRHGLVRTARRCSTTSRRSSIGGADDGSAPGSPCST